LSKTAAWTSSTWLLLAVVVVAMQHSSALRAAVAVLVDI